MANAPIEEEDFEMIDLDTGKAITTSDDEEIDDIVIENEQEIEGIVLDAQSLFENNNQDELTDLELALDAAFDKFKTAQKNLNPEAADRISDDRDESDSLSIDNNKEDEALSKPDRE